MPEQIGYSETVGHLGYRYHHIHTNILNGVLSIQYPGHHLHDSQPNQTKDHHPGIMHGTEPLGNMGVADIYIALDCQGKGQPVGGRVEDLRSSLQGKLK